MFCLLLSLLYCIFLCNKYLQYIFPQAPYPVSPAMFPTWPAKSENPNGLPAPEKISSPKPPSGGKNFKDLVSW